MIIIMELILSQTNMEKISITLNVSKIDKSKIFERTYKDKDGNSVTEKLYKFDLIKVKEPKFVAEGEGWRMIKTHFGAETQTREEREAKKTSNFVADGFTFEKKESVIDPITGIDCADIAF